MKCYINKIEEYYKKTDKIKIKKLGQFFTPEIVANFMAKWVAHNSKVILDPAVGNAIFFDEIRKHNINCKLYGYEIDSEILEHFKCNNAFNIINEDFLQSEWNSQYDGIICNPPYNRFQFIDNRKQILNKFENKTGIKFSGYTNQYILFLIKAIYQLNKKGKLAFIIPAEFMNSQYGKEIKKILISNRLLKTIIYFDSTSIFDNAVTTSCILLLDKTPKKEAEFIRLTTINDISSLDIYNSRLSNNSQLVTYQTLDKFDKWQPILIGEIPKKYRNTVKLKKYANVARGIATGDNKFFIFNKNKIQQNNLSNYFFTECISRSCDVTKPIFTFKELDELKKTNKPVFILTLDSNKEYHEYNLQLYIKYGEEIGTNKKYLTSHRKKWYCTELKPIAPIWITTANRKEIKVVRNVAKILNLTTFHGMYIKPEKSNYINILFSYLLTPIAQNLLKQNKKELGNGLEKFQPGDLNEAYIIDFEKISTNDCKKIELLYKKIVKDNVLSQKIINDLNDIFKAYLI